MIKLFKKFMEKNVPITMLWEKCIKPVIILSC